MQNTNINKKSDNIFFSSKEVDDSINRIDINAIKEGIKKSEEDIKNGNFHTFEDAINQIHSEVFNE